MKRVARHTGTHVWERSVVLNNMKKTLLIVGIVLILLGGGIAFLWFSSETPESVFGDLPQAETETSRTFSPFGKLVELFTGNDSNNQETATTSTPTTTSRSVYDMLSMSGAYEVTEEPVAHAEFFYMGTTTGSVLRYIERETGHVYELNLSSGTLSRLTNTTVPRIQEAFFGNNGSLVALRYLREDNETIETFVGAISTTTSGVSGELDGEFLSQNIQTIALHPQAPGAFYTLKAGGGAVGRLYDPITHQTAALFSSPLSEWKAYWSGPETVLLHTKPSSSAQGFAYLLDPATGGSDRFLTNISGLTTLPNTTGSKILVGSSQTEPKLSLYTTADGSTSSVIGSTFPEKCAWADAVSVVCAIPESASSIDSWYDGSASFSDSIWRIDTTTDLTDFLFDEDRLGVQFDATHLSVSSDGTVLSFINKKDSHLWVASLLEGAPTNTFESESENN